MKTPYRIFLSYSHQDIDQVRIIGDILRSNSLCPISDSEFNYGHGFHDQIKKFIAHAYVFMPVISKSANERGWVHEEIGYAMAHSIPVLPVVIEQDALPKDMINEFQALIAFLKTTNETELANCKNKLKKQLSWEKINLLIESHHKLEPIYECAYLRLERTEMLVDYATSVKYLFNDQQKVFRQSGGLSSLHIPKSYIDSEEWTDRSPDSIDSLNQALRQERIIFEEFATHWGFKIIIDPDLPFDEAKEKSPVIRKSRLTSLLNFLKGLPKKSVNEKNKYEILIDRNLDRRHTIIIIGDFFSAESLAGYQNWGFRQTMFTRHAPTIKKQIEDFDSRFEELKKKQGSDTSVRNAIEEIEKRVSVIQDLSV